MKLDGILKIIDIVLRVAKRVINIISGKKGGKKDDDAKRSEE